MSVVPEARKRASCRRRANERRAGGAPTSTVAAVPQRFVARLRAHHAGLRYEIAAARSYRVHTGAAAYQPATPMRRTSVLDKSDMPGTDQKESPDVRAVRC